MYKRQRADRVAEAIEFFVRLLQPGVGEQISDGLPRPLVKAGDGGKIGHQPLELGVVEQHGGRLVPQEAALKVVAPGPARLRQQAAGRIDRPQRHPQRVRDHAVDLVPGKACLLYTSLGSLTKGFKALGGGSIAGIPIIVIIALAVMLLVWIMLTKTCLGKEIFAVGGNLEAARVSGINVFKIQMITYSIAGACYGLAGALESARTSSATSAYGQGYELDAIASCIVGGCSVAGGVGTVGGVFAGVIIFNVISYGLTFIGISPYWQNVVKGLIIICLLYTSRCV